MRELIMQLTNHRNMQNNEKYYKILVEKVTIATYCSLRPPNIAPEVLGFD